MNCPPLADLILHAAARALPEPLQAHLEAGCPSCEARWRIAKLVPQQARAFSEGPPAHLRKFALELAQGGSALDRLVAFVGKLVSPPELAPALRGATPATQYLYKAGEAYEVDLTHLDSGELLGQLAPTDGSDCDAGGTVIMQRGEASWVSEIDEGGEFQFEEVEAGCYDLLIALDGERILIENIDLE